MSTNVITGDHIISTLRTLGFAESNENLEKPNYISLRKGEHKISVSSGILEAEETTRMRTELAPIFEDLDAQVSASADTTLLTVKDWLLASTPE